MTEQRNQANMLTPGEAAKYLGVNVRTLRRYRESGQVVPDVVLPSGHARFSKETLDALRAPERASA